jgi:hypothetical protein
MRIVVSNGKAARSAQIAQSPEYCCFPVPYTVNQMLHHALPKKKDLKPKI